MDHTQSNLWPRSGAKQGWESATHASGASQLRKIIRTHASNNGSKAEKEPTRRAKLCELGGYTTCDKGAVERHTSAHILRAPFDLVSNHFNRYLVGLKRDIVHHASENKIGHGQLTAFTQDLCDGTGYVVIVVMSKSGAGLFLPGRTATRILPAGDHSTHYGGPSAVKDRVIQGLANLELTEHNLESFLRATLRGAPFTIEN